MDETGEGDTYCWVEIPAAAVRLGSPQEGRGRIDSLQSSRLTTSYTSNSSKLQCGFLHFAAIVSVYFGDITKSCPAIQSHSSQWQRQHRMFAQPQDSYLLVWKLRFSLKYPENLLWHFICALFCVFWWRHHPRRALKKFWHCNFWRFCSYFIVIFQFQIGQAYTPGGCNNWMFRVLKCFVSNILKG